MVGQFDDARLCIFGLSFDGSTHLVAVAGNLGQVVAGPLNGSTELGCCLGDCFDVVGQDVGSAIQVAGKAQLELLGAIAVAGCRFLQFIRQAESSAAGHKPCFAFGRGSNATLLQALA